MLIPQRMRGLSKWLVLTPASRAEVSAGSYRCAFESIGEEGRAVQGAGKKDGVGNTVTPFYVAYSLELPSMQSISQSEIASQINCTRADVYSTSRIFLLSMTDTAFFTREESKVTVYHSLYGRLSMDARRHPLEKTYITLDLLQTTTLQ